MYSQSSHYTPDEIHPSSTIFILLQNPGADEERMGIPACGKTGHALNTEYLPLAGLQRGPEISVGNVLRCRLGNTNSLPTGAVLEGAVAHCAHAHGHVPETTQAVITQGALALRYAYYYNRSEHHVTDSVTAWRGYLLPPFPGVQPSNGVTRGISSTGKAIPTFVTVHTADTFRDPIMSWVSVLDWRRVGEFVRGVWNYPASPPQLRAATDDISEEIKALFKHAETDCTYTVIDTEYIPGTNHLTTLGVGFTNVRGSDYSHKIPSESTILHVRAEETRQLLHNQGDEAFTVLSIDWARTENPIRDWYKWRIKELVKRVPVVFQNAMADIPQLEVNLGITYSDYYQVEDTMLAHAVLWSELPHTLDFLASIYGRYEKFKALWGIDELRYNYGDVVDTQLAWDALKRAFCSDRQAEQVYREQSLKLIPMLLEAKKHGIRVNINRVIEVFNEYSEIIKEVGAYAQLHTGYPINLNSGVQLKRYLYDERGFPMQIDKDTKRPTTDDDAIARLRMGSGPLFDTSKELTLNQDDDKHYSLLRRVADGADPILEARALWAGTWQVVNNYIVGLGRGIYGEQNKNRRKKAREAYWKTGLKQEDVVPRIYPNFAIHAQKTGRWSTTDPPLAQLPSDLRDLICSDEGEICISWDWSAIEPRVLQALTGSVLLKKTFDEGFDLHTWTVCYMFGYDMPPDLVDPHKAPSCEAWRVRYNWKGKDDPRRVFAKQGRYEMWYGGSGSNAAAAAAQFGLSAGDLKVALSKLASSDPAYLSWKVKLEAEIKKTALIRTFMGRPRRFLSKGDSRRREGLDQPMQGAVSDIFNTTAVRLYNQYPQLRWGWGMHDSQKWYVKRSLATPLLIEEVRSIAERTHLIAGQVTRFPVDMSIILSPEQGGRELTVAQYIALVQP